jgi:hypothetical protein
MASVTLDPVRFKNGKLWKARYPSLIDDGNAPRGFQFEPAFQVFAEEMEVFFRIDQQNVVFTAIGDAVTWQSLVPPDPERPAPDVTVTLCNRDPRCCRVHWKRSGAPLTSLRIACHHLEGGPEPETDAWALTRVEGGVYLVIIARDEARHNPKPVRNPDEAPAPGKVRVVGIDDKSRPIYDLFREDFAASLPAEVALEPSFRMHHGERRDFDLLLALPDASVRFKTGEGGQVEMTYRVPGDAPESLLGTPAGDDRRLCTIQWHHATCVANGAETCQQGRTANLYAQVDNAPDLESVDPTVIEPPACDASGVCTKPRDRGEEE